MKTLSLITILSLPAAAVEVFFTSSIAGGHVTPNGTPLSSDTIAELGAFTPGFTPTAANVSQWKNNWQAANRSAYNASVGFFSGSHTITSNSGAFSTTQQGWVWVYNRSGQWALYSKPSWKWPNASDVLAQPVNWAVEDATITVIGTTNTTNEITTAQVSGAASPQVRFADYMQLLFNQNVSLEGDEDGDGQTNFAEYAFGSRPDDSGSTFNSGVTIQTHGTTKHLTANVNKGWVMGVNYMAQRSSDLTNWTTSDITVLQNNSNNYTAHETAPIGTQQKSFLRILAEME